MTEDEQRKRQMAEKDRELKVNNWLFKTQREELMALRLQLLEHEQIAAGVKRQRPNPRLLSGTRPIAIYLVMRGQSERVPLEVYPHERVWKIHMIACRHWDHAFEATYLAVGDSELGEYMIVQEAVNPFEEIELNTWLL